MTPVNPDVLERLLKLTNYDPVESQFLVQGFRRGFPLGYTGPSKRRDTSNNIPLSVGTEEDIWEKVMKEVEVGRYSRPYCENNLPYKYFVQSPIGLVPKAGKQLCLIFHLSYDFKSGEKSINHWIPEEI